MTSDEPKEPSTNEPPFKIVIECRDQDVAMYIRQHIHRELAQIDLMGVRAPRFHLSHKSRVSDTVLGGEIPVELGAKF